MEQFEDRVVPAVRMVNNPFDFHIPFTLNLREAMQQLIEIENEGNHSITFVTNVTTITLDPAKGQLPNLFRTGGQQDPHVFLTIDGGTNGVTIQRDQNAQQQHRIFENSADTTLTLLNLTIANGKTDVGGAVSSFGDLTIDNCSFANNSATDSGGAIKFTDGGTLQILDSLFELNSAPFGGAIFITSTAGSVAIANTTIQNNTATDSGGGIYIAGSNTQTATPVFLFNVDVGGNTAKNKGGGIYVDSSAMGVGTSLTLAGNCNVHDNQLVNPNPNYVTKGGGIYFGKGTLTATSVTIGGNTAKKGTGLYLVTGVTLMGMPTFIPPNSQDGGAA